MLVINYNGGCLSIFRRVPLNVGGILSELKVSLQNGILLVGFVVGIVAFFIEQACKIPIARN